MKTNLLQQKKLEMIDKDEYKLCTVGGRQRFKKNIDLSKEVQNVRKRILEKTDSFSSLQEVMVAIQLENQGIKYETQKEINGKKVDFFIPDLKIILEIDGELYHTDKEKEFVRDREIMSKAGEEYEIVHIDAESVPRETWNLKEALPFIVESRDKNNMFRDSRLDTYWLEKFRLMQAYLKGGQNIGRKTIFRSNRQT